MWYLLRVGRLHIKLDIKKGSVLRQPSAQTIWMDTLRSDPALASSSTFSLLAIPLCPKVHEFSKFHHSANFNISSLYSMTIFIALKKLVQLPWSLLDNQNVWLFSCNWDSSIEHLFSCKKGCVFHLEFCGQFT